jgi:hypothetical protein
MRYGSVAAMIDYLDREEREEAKERKMRTRLRKLPPRLRKFALTLKRVLVDIPGPENLHREKIMKALNIRRAMYLRTLKEVDEMLS